MLLWQNPVSIKNNTLCLSSVSSYCGSWSVSVTVLLCVLSGTRLYICIYTFMCIFTEPQQVFYGFPGKAVTLPCEGFIANRNSDVTTLEWRKCVRCKGYWSSVSMTLFDDPQDIKNFFKSELDRHRAKVTLPSGNLTIMEFEINDAGLYQCVWENSEPKTMQLKLYGLSFIL